MQPRSAEKCTTDYIVLLSLLKPKTRIALDEDSGIKFINAVLVKRMFMPQLSHLKSDVHAATTLQ